jgi:hypothetical protein
MNDADTVLPTEAEQLIAYLRKSIISLVPVALAVILVVSNAVDSGTPFSGVTVWTAIAAGIQALAVALPGNAVVKAVASLAVAIGAGILAGISDGRFTTAEVLVVAVQILTWASAAVVSNGARPAVVQAAIRANKVQGA